MSVRVIAAVLLFVTSVWPATAFTFERAGARLRDDSRASFLYPIRNGGGIWKPTSEPIEGSASDAAAAARSRQDEESAATDDLTASSDHGVFTLRGSGTDIWGTADEFHFSHRTMTGDGVIVARVASVSGSHPWTKAGVMMRESLAAGSRHASMFVTTGNGLAFQRRGTTAGLSTHTGGGSGTAPSWIRLVRSGATFSAYRSADGATWTLIGTDTITMTNTIYVGLAVTSHENGSTATASFDNVSTTIGPPPPAPPPLPSDWSNVDVGSVGVSGASSLSGSTFTVHGAGADIWGIGDEFQFAYRTLTGDGTITARVATLEAVDVWTKAGVMVRASLTAQSRHAMMIVSSARGLAFQRRVTDGGPSTHTSGGTATAPHWVRIERTGNNLMASVSTDGAGWTVVGTETIAMPATVYVGLAVTSHVDASLATATFDSVSVTP